MTRIAIDPARPVGRLDRKVFGGFVEHLGRCIYGGLYEEGSPLSDDRGFRKDVLGLLRELRLGVLRWPGGNFVSNYHWADGIGPKDDRPRRPELAWGGEESNRFGTDEYLAYCAELGTEPYVCLNMGTGTLEEALAWVEYCNSAGQTHWAARRRANGRAEPWRVTYWGLGNEMYGDWQVGAFTAEEYVREATRWARAIRMLDPQAKLVSCGMNGWNEWDRVVIDGMASLVDYHSLHIYTGSDDYWTNVLQPHQAERAIRCTQALIERAAYRQKIASPPRIAYDEWNVWYRNMTGALEERYTFADALAVGTYLNIFTRNCDWVRMANLAQMVNAIAPVVTSAEVAAVQPIWYPVLLHAQAALDLAVDVHVNGPVISGGSSSGGGGGSASTPASTASASPSVTVVAGGSCSPSATKVLFWAWVPGMGRAVTEFNKTHPSICVTQEDVGAGDPEYVAITNALKGGSGAPDVAEVEFDELPSFEVTHNVVNLVPYGANNYKNKFTTWAWDEVSQGSSVYAMPGDAGPMAFYYNTKELAKYGITPPTTWAQFAADAAKLHKANPGAYMTNFSAIDLQWVMSLMAQDNAWPFAYSGGSNVTINWTGPQQMAFAAYWQNLLSAHEVNATTDVSATSFADMDKGIDASWISSAWGPSYFAPDAKSSLGDWRATALPQWTAGANVAANWGGSTYPVFSQSKHPAEAAQFAEWLNATDASWNITKTAPSSLFPTYLPLLSDPSFKNITVPLSGTSTPDVAFSAAASSIKGVPWPPFMTEALTQSATVFAGVMNGKETLQTAFKNFQNVLVTYAKAQGFTVST